jgi:3-oxoacyl-[acyl-carrier-protein] synthase II
MGRGLQEEAGLHWSKVKSGEHYLSKAPEGDWLGKIPPVGPKGAVPPMGDWTQRVVGAVTQHLHPGEKEAMVLQVATSRGLLDYLAEELMQKEIRDIRLSPYSTFGFLSSWPHALKDWELPGMHSFSSSTCSSFGGVLLNAMAYLSAEMVDYFVAAAVEAPCSLSTLRQMKALKIYADSEEVPFPCQSMNLSKNQNSMVLSEAAHAFLLSSRKEQALAQITGLGVYKEIPNSATGLSENAWALQKAMEQSMSMAGGGEVDCVIGHFPGTVMGDRAEQQAYAEFFASKLPYITNVKWKLGHSLGASMATGLEVGLLSLLHQEWPPLPPYLSAVHPFKSRIHKVMVNGLGFGGQAVSIVLENTQV